MLLPGSRATPNKIHAIFFNRANLVYYSEEGIQTGLVSLENFQLMRNYFHNFLDKPDLKKDSKGIIYAESKSYPECRPNHLFFPWRWALADSWRPKP